MLPSPETLGRYGNTGALRDPKTNQTGLLDVVQTAARWRVLTQHPLGSMQQPLP